MKALMSMFVEIMGMSMDADKMKSSKNNNNNDNKKKGPVFMFGNSNNGGIPVPPGGWSDASARNNGGSDCWLFRGRSLLGGHSTDLWRDE